MADLESELLAAAGRTSAPMRTQVEGSYFDEGSDSGNDESDHDVAYSIKKWPGFQVPLKKRLDAPGKANNENIGENDEYQGSSHLDGSSDESDVGSDHYKIEPRGKLAQMSELHREMFLSEQAERRSDRRLAKRVKAKQSGKEIQPRKETPPSPSFHLRSAARTTEREAAKDVALKAIRIRARRMKHQDSEGHLKLNDADRGGKSVNKYILPSSQIFIKTASSSESQSESHGRDEGYVRYKEVEDSDEGRTMDNDVVIYEDIQEVTYDDIKDITIPRSKLAKWLMEPFFEELIVGCFVRVGFEKRDNKGYYRLCMVKDVDATTPHLLYKLENSKTYKQLNVMWGSHKDKFEMSMTSESSPSESEFREWVDAMKEGGIQIPSQHALREKQEAIQKVNNPSTWKHMLQEYKPASLRPVNIAAEKDRLRRELELAKSSQNGVKVESIQARLQELATISRQAMEKDVKAVKLEQMNKKNRVENFKTASQMKPVNTALKAGQAGYDPFSRRWTRSRNYYVSNPGRGGEAAPTNEHGIAKSSEPSGSNQAGAGGKAEADMETTRAALESVSGAGKLVNTSAPVDQRTTSNWLHGFKLPISLAKLQMLGGPQGVQEAFMERKQKIEASIGYKVPEDTREHTQVLSISEYKMRRGLL